MFYEILAEFKGGQGRLPAGGIELVGLVELAFDLLKLRFQVERFDLEGLLVDGAGQVAVKQPVLHVDQLGAVFGQYPPLLGLDSADLAEARLQRVAEPSGVRLGQRHGGQFLLDGRFDLRLAPPNLRMPIVGMVVAAAVVDVLVATAVVELAADQLTRHGEVAAGAAEDTAGEHNVRVALPPVAAVEDVLADIEQLAVDQLLIASLEHLAVAFKFANVEAVIQDVRQCRAMESRLAGLVGVAFGVELVGQALKGEPTAGVELKDANDGPGFLRVRHDRLLTVADVQVAVRGEARGPALPHLLVHALDDLAAQIV